VKMSESERDRLLAVIESERDQLAAEAEAEEAGEIDWTLPPAEINGILRAYWSEIELDKLMRPVRAKWRFGGKRA